MQLVLTEDQELIAKTAADFVAEKSPIARVRELRDSADATGFSRPLWQEMAELGWVGIPFPESVGGAGLGLAELAVVMEALGRSLAPEPFLSTVLLGGQTILRGGTEDQRGAWLPGVVDGSSILSLAYQEASSRYELRAVTCQARASGDGFVLSGEKTQVLDAHVADAILVSARTSGGPRDAHGISVFRVPANAKGLEVLRQARLDGRNAAIVRLHGVEASRDDVIGEVDEAARLLEDVADLATAGLCAEMLGGMSQAFEMTLEHLKARQQFEVPIGTFQALKHRAADVFIEIELARSAVMAAARALDSRSDEARQLVSLAKARCSDAYLQAANEGVQMFGGVGMTDEYEIGFFLKRARAAEMTLGDAAFHRDRWARSSGY